jgi:pyruvate,water dikinase
MMPLTGLHIPDPLVVGSKAASLCRLDSLGFRIAPGFIFDTSYCESLFTLAGLRDRIQWLQENGPLLKEAYVLALGKEIIQQLQDTDLPQTFEQDLERCFVDLSQDGSSLICRSSCLLEDSECGAFPGVFRSEAGLTNMEDLKKAVRSCVGSLFQPKALRYWLRMPRQSVAFSMGLLIQPWVNSRCTGVMFFEHSERILVEVVSGKGELLMSGQMAPMTYRKGDQHSWNSNGPEMDGDLLREDHLQELARIGALAAKTWKSAVDIEFGFFDGECTPYLFQCRPVTEPWPFTCTSPSVGHSRKVDVYGVSCSPGMAQGVGMNWSIIPKIPTPSSQSIALVDFLSEQHYDLIFDIQGIVSEQVGSQLNHLSIACRELGIPYVSGVDQARTRFHEQSVVLDGTKGTVSVIAEDFPAFAKHGTVVPSDVGHRMGDSGCAPKSASTTAASPDLTLGFHGGVSLLLEGLYHGTTEADLVEGMVRYLGEVFKNETSHEVVRLRLPRLFAEEGSFLRQVVPECSFSPEMEARVFQQVIEKVRRFSGRNLVLDVSGDQMGEC